MSNEQLPFYRVPGTKDGANEPKYFLRSENGEDTEITEWQYNQLTATTEQPVSGNSAPADIARLHAEQDPASPLFKGSEPAGTGVSELASGESKTTSVTNEPSARELEEAGKGVAEPQGTTALSTEEASKPAEFVQEETPLDKDIDHVITEEDLKNNPDLAEQDVSVGDPVTIPANAQTPVEEVEADQASAQETLDNKDEDAGNA